MKPTYVGSSSVPADNQGAFEPNVFVLTPPGGLLAGDLVVVCLPIGNPQNADAWSIEDDGGQAWGIQYNNMNIATGTMGMRAYACTFNGSWSNNPAFRAAPTGGKNPASAIMHVFRPPNGFGNWALSTPPGGGYFGQLAAPDYTVNVQGQNSLHDHAISLAWWHTPTALVWGPPIGAGWSVAGLNQYRNNVNGNKDTSDAFAYFAHDVAGPSGNVSRNRNADGVGGAVILTMFASAV